MRQRINRIWLLTFLTVALLLVLGTVTASADSYTRDQSPWNPNGDIWVLNDHYVLWTGTDIAGPEGTVKDGVIDSYDFAAAWENCFDDVSEKFSSTSAISISGTAIKRNVFVYAKDNDYVDLYLGNLDLAGGSVYGGLTVNTTDQAIEVYLDVNSFKAANIDIKGDLDVDGGSLAVSGNLSADGIYFSSSESNLVVTVAGNILVSDYYQTGGSVTVQGNLTASYKEIKGDHSYDAGDIYLDDDKDTVNNAPKLIVYGNISAGYDIETYDNPDTVIAVDVYVGGNMTAGSRIEINGGYVKVLGKISTTNPQEDETIYINGGTVFANEISSVTSLYINEDNDWNWYGAVRVTVTGNLTASKSLVAYGGILDIGGDIRAQRVLLSNRYSYLDTTVSGGIAADRYEQYGGVVSVAKDITADKDDLIVYSNPFGPKSLDDLSLTKMIGGASLHVGGSMTSGESVRIIGSKTDTILQFTLSVETKGDLVADSEIEIVNAAVTAGGTIKTLLTGDSIDISSGCVKASNISAAKNISIGNSSDDVPRVTVTNAITAADQLVMEYGTISANSVSATDGGIIVLDDAILLDASAVKTVNNAEAGDSPKPLSRVTISGLYPYAPSKIAVANTAYADKKTFTVTPGLDGKVTVWLLDGSTTCTVPDSVIAPLTADSVMIGTTNTIVLGNAEQPEIALIHLTVPGKAYYYFDLNITNNPINPANWTFTKKDTGASMTGFSTDFSDYKVGLSYNGGAYSVWSGGHQLTSVKTYLPAGNYRMIAFGEKAISEGGNVVTYAAIGITDFTISPLTITIKAEDANLNVGASLPESYSIKFSDDGEGYLTKSTTESQGLQGSFNIYNDFKDIFSAGSYGNTTAAGTAPIYLEVRDDATTSAAAMYSNFVSPENDKVANLVANSFGGMRVVVKSGTMTVGSSGGGHHNPGTAGSNLPVTSTGKGNTGTTVNVAYTKTGNEVKVELNKQTVADLIKTELKQDTVSINLSGIAGTKTVSIPKEGLTALTAASGAGEAKNSLSIELPGAKMVFSPEALTGLTSQAGTEGISITADNIGSGSLSEAQKAIVGDKTVYELTAKSGSNYVTSFNGNVTVSLPYTLKEGENPEGVSVYYMNSEGKLTEISCTYDKKTGMATFTTNHFSHYLVGYSAVGAFKDVAKSAWYYEAVAFAAENGLFSGTSASSFSPQTAMTRAMFVSVLARLNGVDLSSYKTSAYSDVSITSWYGKAVAWAAEKGIVSGYGNSTFGPNDKVTREQMCSIFVKYAAAAGVTLTSDKTAVTFNDSSSISTWAAGAVKTSQQAGLVSGKNGNVFDPQGTSTRAEVATVFMNFMKAFIK